MRKYILLTSLFSITLFIHAQDSLSIERLSSAKTEKQISDNNIKYITFRKNVREYPAFFKDTTLTCCVYNQPYIPLNDYHSLDRESNWFINVAGGVSAFIGDPLGCEDLFGRIRPMFHLSAGKWFSPTVGGRIAFQGFALKNHFIENQHYQHIHADFLWNVTRLTRKGRSQPRWQFIPFAGLGIISNNTTHNHPFAVNYGVLNNIRLLDCLSLSLELGGMTTFGDFDGAGRSNKFSDHLFHLSVGFIVKFGKQGWKQPTLSQPYTNHSDSKTSSSHKPNDTSYTQAYDTYPQNDYSGLNSLRHRLSALSGGQDTLDENENTNSLDSVISIQDTLSDVQSQNRQAINRLINGKVSHSSPILFFFKIGTSALTDNSQLANLQEIATVCKKHNLQIKVTGYADSATGDATGNSALSIERAHYITEELLKRGILKEAVTQQGKGGISTYSPVEVNRCVKVEIYSKQQ